MTAHEWDQVVEHRTEDGGMVRDYYAPRPNALAKQTTQGSTTRRRHHTRANVATTQKVISAIQMRMKGYTYQAIADQVGYKSRAAAYNAIHDELDHYADQTVEEYRHEALAQLDEIQRKLWGEAMNGGKGGTVDTWKLDRLLAVMEKRHKLLGLYPKDGNAAEPPVVIIRGLPQEVIDAI